MKGFTAAATVFWLCASVIAEQPPTLDLTSLPRNIGGQLPGGTAAPIEAGTPEIVHGGGSSALPATQLPLSVVLTSITPSICVWGEEIVYEIDLTNRGSEPLLLPWSLASRSDVPTGQEIPSSYRELAVALVMKSGTIGEHVVFPVSAVFGWDALPGSLRALAPGQQFRIRASAECRPSSAPEQDRLESALPRTTLVHARVTLRTQPRIAGTSIDSPGIELTLLPR